MGMANYLSKFVTQLAVITMPLKDLLREKIERVWGEPQQTALKTKAELSFFQTQQRQK